MVLQSLYTDNVFVKPSQATGVVAAATLLQLVNYRFILQGECALVLCVSGLLGVVVLIKSLHASAQIPFVKFKFCLHSEHK